MITAAGKFLFSGQNIKYPDFTTNYLGYYNISINGAGIVSNIDLDHNQEDRQIVVAMTVNRNVVTGYTCSINGTSLPRRVAINGSRESAPGTAIFVGNPDGPTGTLVMSGSLTSGVIGVWSVYKGQNSIYNSRSARGAGTGPANFSVTTPPGNSVVIAASGFRNAGIERYGAGGFRVYTSSGSRTVTASQSTTTQLSGAVSQNYNRFIGSTGDTDPVAACAIVIAEN